MKVADSIDASATVHIVDDDPALRRSIDGLLRSSGYTSLQYGSVDEFLASDMLDKPGCLVLDVRLPGMSGLEFQSRLRDQGTSMPVILMTGFGDVPMSVQGMKAGAVDFLPKPFAAEQMLSAVSAALTRDKAARAQNAHLESLRTLWAALSSREREVMTLVAAGKLNKQIAFDLGISEVTVKVHRSNGMRKLGATTIIAFAKIADELGINASR
ncbi:response regulator transcription factor [Sphingomonas xinjiangensis]|uniref:FixJ family two-component response regulator n=1 Tax=Sphingomonas xinjiangensis TaxID=643568 RepID=A0A840YS57_9SPHN|nr:response regulator [Sphingomonas xinjiangensis]MBB5712504.1 FixJ family two-component response regulator [Sphingomonas xinjiangensis]